MVRTSAAWHGTRIILRQVSEEAIGIFDFIMELYNWCSGQWIGLAKDADVDVTSLEEFLTYAATFLSNVGNYYVLLSTCPFTFHFVCVDRFVGPWRSKIRTKNHA